MTLPRLVLVYPSYSKIIGSAKYKRYGVYAGLGNIPERPHVGLGYLSQNLLNNGIDHQYIDMNHLKGYAEFKSKLKKIKPDVIGITMVTPGYLRGYKLIKRIKKDFPKAKIIVGGPHVSTFMAKIFKECKEIDAGFVSEAENSLVNYLKNNNNPEKIPGVIYKKSRKIIFNPPKLEENIDKLGFPKYEKFDLTKYSTPSLYTSRGCPFRCVFCTVESYRRKQFRPRSVNSIIKEINYWYQKGQRLFAVEDDNFTFDYQRVSKLCDQLKKLKLKDVQFALGQGVRADRVDRRLLRKMYNTGFKYATIAVEGGNNKVLRNLKKGETIERIEKTIKDACEIGYEVRLLFVVGAKGETYQDVEDCFTIMKKYPIMYGRFNNLFPIPGTELYDWVIKEKLNFKPPEKFLNGYRMDYTEPWYETPEFSKEERKKTIIESDKVNEILFYRYLNKKLSPLGPFKYPVSYFASRRIIQDFINNNPRMYEAALKVRQVLSK
jgi:anaerobic magnesium-protoporphyrin IX monomethyl ester cyclase